MNGQDSKKNIMQYNLPRTISHTIWSFPPKITNSSSPVTASLQLINRSFFFSLLSSSSAPLSHFTSPNHRKRKSGRKSLQESKKMSVKFLFLAVVLSFIPFTFSIPSIGVTYSNLPTTGAARPPPAKISDAISAMKFTHVRLPDSDPSLIKSFAFSNTSLFLSIPNPLLPALAANRSAALQWIYSHVLPYYPRSKIALISVGNAVFDSTKDYSPFLLPAIRNLHFGLQELGVNKIPVSTTFSFFSTITTAFPPSSAQFQQPAGELIIKPLLQFLGQTNSSFLINLYPYNLFRLNSEIPIGFALFQDYPFNFRDDLVTGVRYFNLFDMMADAVITAMAVVGHENIPVIVAETGWPSSGGEPGEVEANEVYAEMYFKGLIRHLKSGVGTPLRKEGISEVYVYELIDHSDGANKEKGRKWGLLSENMTVKYDVDFSNGVQIQGSFSLLWICLVFSVFWYCFFIPLVLAIVS